MDPLEGERAVRRACATVPRAHRLLDLHHADPTAARHGVDRWQLDSSAELLGGFEVLGWAHDVRWPERERIAARRVVAGA